VAIDDYDANEEFPCSEADLLRNFHSGTAVFRLEQDGWVTDGRAILNLAILSLASGARIFRRIACFC
jgi:hypothetical protein